ncbi:NAD(P)-dependent oxidoreductase [Ochrobactrum sp. MYb15]|uniref:SDR family oxidoreductase n=1 Tax=Brucella TaxID=234 RepID=UPI0004644AB2|nr:SDR family oxidoreductase [Brucella rhizosphaerae]PQZ51255.1 NAD(P)-dependent oxidoreductase [Ochrobactrum sp. MYb19]PRA50582.1 NAD(P)-dependent oxidoreductase [Ochrobactrum sp. MYb68]PRA65711.1 NAD(P)-dependent oxidoreductase [Ochrobactrum sp. MYb18]PRA77401.1 NAD(P)-dependent oxidoreductase [Brucella thiophenivorans]PRA92964.1 NAD(P)-dependent oxidoreductase [Ochrobactrum sp. MYb14]PRA99411.1 NAD(P)-dependent oxidoreductase [Ochrobactrum sp. MYb15]
MRIFLFGAGYSARAFSRLMTGEAERIDGTTRNEQNFPTLEKAGIAPIIFDGETASPELIDRLAKSTHVVISISPRESGDPSLAIVEEALRRPDNTIRWIGYLSTVGVYGNHDGNWIDETTPCEPSSRRSLERVEAENAWNALSERHGTPVALLRLSGIYGPGRNAFINLERGTARRIIKEGQVFNRIHVEDIAGTLRFLAGTNTGGAFNITDNEPAPPQDVVVYAAELMGVAPPPEVPFEDADMTPMARSFYGENKRVSNQRIKDLGYDFIHPDYKAAFSAMWRDDNWR